MIGRSIVSSPGPYTISITWPTHPSPACNGCALATENLTVVGVVYGQKTRAVQRLHRHRVHVNLRVVGSSPCGSGGWRAHTEPGDRGAVATRVLDQA